MGLSWFAWQTWYPPNPRCSPTHMLHVCNFYQHVPYKCAKCRQIFQHHEASGICSSCFPPTAVRWPSWGARPGDCNPWHRGFLEVIPRVVVDEDVILAMVCWSLQWFTILNSIFLRTSVDVIEHWVFSIILLGWSESTIFSCCQFTILPWPKNPSWVKIT